MIGIVMPLGSPRGGAEILLQNWLSASRMSSRYVLAFLEEGPLVAHARSLGYDVEVMPTTHLRHVGNTLQTILALRSWIRRKHLRVVLSWMAKAHLYIAPASSLLGVRTVWYQHGVPDKSDRMNQLITALPAQAVLCCSETARATQQKWSSKHNLYVCYPGVDAPDHAVTAEQARGKLGLSPEETVICMVARLERWKGAHVLVQAAPEVLAAHPECRFFIAGGPHPFDPSYAEELKAMIRTLDLNQRVILLGQLPPEEVRLWQISSDLIVQPTSGIEPFGIAVVEAMSLGKVVVASDLGGPAEVIQQDRSGVLFPPRDAGGLAKTIVALLSDPERRQRIGREAIQRSEQFSMRVFVDRLDELLGEIAAL